MAQLADYGLGPGQIALLERRCVRVVYVVGDSDTGKSTLAAALAAHLARKFKAALVGLDAGQASIGLPTTFAWGMCGRGGRARTDGMYFTGTTSPTGYFEIAVAGAAAMVSEARGHAAKVVVDTCGLACGPAAMQLHHATIDAVRADAVVAIERDGELSGLVGPFIRSGRPLVIRASVPGGVRKRSRATRRSYRRGKFRAYFKRARELTLSLDEVGVLRPRPDPVGRIASLRDASGRDIALAIVRAVDDAAQTMTVLSPVPRRTNVRAVVLGSMRIARDGRQLARNV